MGKRKPIPVDPTPASHLEAIQAAGFDVLSYQNVAIQVRDSSGELRSEWLPRHLVNWQTKGFIEFQRASDPENNYSFDGWTAKLGHTCGGTYPTVAGALGWFVWFEEQKKR
jgi:hypothetical protein